MGRACFSLVALAVLCLGGTTTGWASRAEPEAASQPAGDPFADPAVAHAMGWRDLTGPDYKDLWRAYKGDQFPAKGWRWAGNVLAHDSQAGGGDIVTREQYEDFELEGMFQCAPQGNSGIMYRVQETLDAPWMSGPEYQVLDDIGQGLARDHKHSAGGMYDLFPPLKAKPINPGAHWNKFRIVLRQGVVQHWLNDVKVVEARLARDDGTADEGWTNAIAASKFKDYAGFGLAPRGHLALQDHGDWVAYRNIKLRELP